MEFTNVLVDKRDHIGFITLNRPQAMNTFNVPFARELNDALWEMEKDPEIRVVVIDANGKHFSVGISLDEFKDKSNKEYREFICLMDEHNHTIAKMKKPVIASVKGYALANGAGLSFACDLTVAAEDAKFGTTAINVGLICLGPAAPLARNVGLKKALEMVLTGDIISAAEAQRLGWSTRWCRLINWRKPPWNWPPSWQPKARWPCRPARPEFMECKMSLITRVWTCWANVLRVCAAPKMPRKASGLSGEETAGVARTLTLRDFWKRVR